MLNSHVIVCLLTFCFNRLALGSEWGYSGKHGQLHWCAVPDSSESQCCGKHQSPVNIDEKEIVVSGFPALALSDYDTKPKELNLANNGHTVVLELGKNDTRPTMSGAGLNDTFIFSSLHFHWGLTNKVGSEHTVDDMHYAAEMHMVHFNKKYGSQAVAVKNADGLAVLAIFFELSEKDNDDLRELVKALSDVRYNGDHVIIKDPFPLNDLMPEFTSEFYRYRGSLTTPPCSEVVTWTILKATYPISDKQMEKFRSLRVTPHTTPEVEAERLVDNFRNVQKMGGRQIYARMTTSRIRRHNDAGHVRSSLSVTLLICLAALLRSFGC